MTTTARNLTKSREKRLSEVLEGIALKSGKMDSQIILSGCVLVVGTTNTQVGLTAGEVVIAQSLVTIAAIASQALPAGAATGAGQFLKVLAEVDAGGVLTLTAGVIAATQALAVLPALTATRIAIGWVEVPASFVVGTTVVTGGMLKPMLYSA